MGVFGADERVLSPGETATGPDLGAWDSFKAVFNEAYSVDTALGFEADLQARFADSVQKLRVRTGQPDGYTPALTDVHRAFVRPLVDPNGDRLAASAIFGGNGQPNPYSDANELTTKELNEQIKALGDPTIKSAEDLIKEIQGEYLQKTQASADADFLPGLAGGVLGNLAAMATLRDAPSLLTLPFGGWGKTIAKRVATEALVGGATELAVQETSIQPQRELLGLPAGGVAESVLASTILGGALRGAFEGGSRLFKFGADEAPAAPFELTDDNMRAVFEANPESPSSRAGLHLLEQDQAFRAANPYGDTETGQLRFEEDLTQLRLALGGLPDTAIARVLPETGLPLELENLSLDVQIVRERSPQIYQRVVNAQARLNELDDSIVRAADDIDRIGPAEALLNSSRDLPEADRQTGELLQGYREELERPGLTSARRDDIERKVNQIVESSGGWERVDQLMQEVQQTGRIGLRTLRASRKAAKKEIHAARAELDRAVELVKLEQRVAEMRQGASPERAGKTELPIFDNRPDAVAAKFAQVAERKLPANTEMWDELMKDTEFFRGPQLVKNEAGAFEIDLGNGKTVPRDTEIPHPDNPAKSIKLENVIKDLESDVAQIEAMKGCTL
jgi:hypothetical protein